MRGFMRKIFERPTLVGFQQLENTVSTNVDKEFSIDDRSMNYRQFRLAPTGAPIVYMEDAGQSTSLRQTKSYRHDIGT
jgi:hypothetical protein